MNTSAAAADLNWLYETAIPYFERSTFGPVLERQELYYVVRDTGWQDRVTAWPTAEYNSSNREPPSRGLSIRAGAIWSKLQDIAQRSPQHARALAFAFGHDGAAYARTERGRTVALFPLVPAGIALIARARRASNGSLDMSDADRLRVEVTVDFITGGRDRLRRQLITVALREAEALLTEALEMWVAMGRDPARPLPGQHCRGAREI